MAKKKDWLKHAFAVDPPGAAEPTAEQQGPVDRVCREVVKRHMTTPALLALEALQPMNFVGSQAMHFFHPFVSVFTDTDGYRHFAAFLERRGSVEYLCRRIEEMEAECETTETPDESPTEPGDDDDGPPATDTD
ncbi:MAG: hypothetical protein D8M59_09025 [Planctomycetes bacterium]|nr:hypothetical protein [Planctomycetota bacterium]NOG54202.1 hypothetical protein [Planctomycetota bacterium]